MRMVACWSSLLAAISFLNRAAFLTTYPFVSSIASAYPSSFPIKSFNASPCSCVNCVLSIIASLTIDIASIIFVADSSYDEYVSIAACVCISFLTSLIFSLSSSHVSVVPSGTSKASLSIIFNSDNVKVSAKSLNSSDNISFA